MTTDPQKPNVPDENIADRFSALFEQHGRSIYGHIRALVPNASDADEVFQETCVTLWRKFDQYRPDTDFRAWASRIAYYKVLKLRDRQIRSPRLFSPEFLNVVSDELIVMSDVLDARTEALVLCRDKLNRRDQELLERFHREGSTAKEVARRVGRNVHYVYRSVRRIHDSLLDCIKRRHFGGARRMTADRRQFDELRDLLWSIEDGSISDDGVARIDELVREDEALLRQYIEYSRLVSDLRFGANNDRSFATLERTFGIDEEESGLGVGEAGFGIGDSEVVACGFTPAAEAAGPPPSAVSLSPLSLSPLPSFRRQPGVFVHGRNADRGHDAAGRLGVQNHPIRAARQRPEAVDSVPRPAGRGVCRPDHGNEKLHLVRSANANLRRFLGSFGTKIRLGFGAVGNRLQQRHTSFSKGHANTRSNPSGAAI